MRLALPSFALLLPALLDSVAFAACQEKDGQIFLQEEGKWTLQGFASTNCGGENTTHTGGDDEGYKPINNGVSSLAYRYDGIKKFKLCLWGDADCSPRFYRGPTPGDKDLTCHNVIKGLAVESFTVVNSTKPCHVTQ